MAANSPIYYRLRWPDTEVPEDAPAWLHYEVSEAEDAVLRTVEVFSDGRIARNSIEIEKRNGISCPSLIDTTPSDGFEGMELERIPAAAFDDLWLQGIDTPFWNVR